MSDQPLPYNDESQFFASLTPRGGHTIRAVTGIFDTILSENQSSRHHANFIRANSRALVASASPAFSPEPDSLSSGYTTEADLSDDGQTSSDFLGCYVLSLEKNLRPQKPGRGWTFGQGGIDSRGESVDVDLLLPDPAEFIPRTTSLVYPHHGHFAFELESQQLFIYARHKGISVNDQALEPKTKMLMQKRENIKIGPYSFVFEYKVREENEEEFQRRKRQYMTNHKGLIEPFDYLSPTPSMNDLFINGYLLNGIAGATKATIIHTAIHSKSGKVLAAKRLRLNPSNPTSADRELAMYKSVTTGLSLHRYREFVMRNKEVLGTPSSSIHEAYMLWEPYVGGDFSRFGLLGNWLEIAIDTKKILFVQVCLGVGALHEAGWIHRDLKPANLGVVRLLQNPQACVLDLGQAVRQPPSGSVGHMAKAGSCGTIGFLAPEMENSEYATGYGKEVDVWSLGAIGYFLFFGGRIPWNREYNMFLPREKHDPSLQVFREVRGSLLAQPRHSLEWLVGTMLEENPLGRPKIPQILAHVALKGVRDAIDAALDSKSKVGQKRKEVMKP